MSDTRTQDEGLQWIELAREPEFALGAACVRPGYREVLVGSVNVSLQPRVMQVLVCLAQGGGEPVSRTLLVQRCWGGVAVGDDAINRCIQRLRRLGAEEAPDCFVIETIPKVGYRLRATTSTPKPAQQSRPSATCVCVLPFANLSGDPEQAYFSEGITEDIVTDLGKVQGLSVVALTWTFALAGEALDVREVARRMNVSHVVTGSVRRAGGRVRISAKLAHGASAVQLWAERYDRELKDIFAVQDEIARAIARALQVELATANGETRPANALLARGTTDPQAYDLYLMARRRYVAGDQGDPDWGPTIIRLAGRATEIDPDYAHGWVLLALGHAAAGWMLGWDSARGLEPVERGIALRPELAEAYAVKARILSDTGHYDRAIEQLDIAFRLGPDSWLVNYCAAVVRLNAGRHDEAVPYYEAAMALDETDINSPAFLVNFAVRSRGPKVVQRFSQVLLDHAQAALARDSGNASAMALCCRALGFLGRLDEAKAWMDRALLSAPDNAIVRQIISECLITHFGDVDAALDVLQPMLATVSRRFLGLVRSSPHLAPVHGRPRFQAMMAAASARVDAEG